MLEQPMNSPVDALIPQIAELRRIRVEDVKAHQEALDAAVHDVQRLDRVLAMLQAEDEPDLELADDTDPREPSPVTGEGPPLSVPHTIDVGAVAAALPRHNPFAERPTSLAWALWEIMQAGEVWRVGPDLQLALKRMGQVWSETTVRNRLRDHPTVFESSGGAYRVTVAYRNHAEAPHA